MTIYIYVWSEFILRSFLVHCDAAAFSHPSDGQIRRQSAPPRRLTTNIRNLWHSLLLLEHVGPMPLPLIWLCVTKLWSTSHAPCAGVPFVFGNEKFKKWKFMHGTSVASIPRIPHQSESYSLATSQSPTRDVAAPSLIEMSQISRMGHYPCLLLGRIKPMKTCISLFFACNLRAK